MTSLDSEISLSVMRTSSRISSARFRSSIPSSVKRTLREPFVPRIKSCLPSSCSSAFNWVDRVGCERCSDSAAAEMLCSLATARKYCNTRSSITIASWQKYSAHINRFQLYKYIIDKYLI